MANDICEAERNARDNSQRERDAAQEELQRLTGGFDALEISPTPVQEQQIRRARDEERRLAEILREKQKELDKCEGQK